jgi:hypothetical protein
VVRRFNPRSPWGERPPGNGYLSSSEKVSIHAPRGGSDLIYGAFLALRPIVSIHAPRGGSDFSASAMRYCGSCFNPRSPWGERHRVYVACGRGTTVSIHAPRGGSDPSLSYALKGAITFQSTLPVGGATCSLLPVPGAARRISQGHRLGRLGRQIYQWVGGCAQVGRKNRNPRCQTATTAWQPQKILEKGGDINAPFHEAEHKEQVCAIAPAPLLFASNRQRPRRGSSLALLCPEGFPSGRG